MRAQQLLERLVGLCTVGQLGHRHDHNALEALARDGQLALLLEHPVDLRGDAMLEARASRLLRIGRGGGDREACVLLVVWVR